mgnify:FL=1
MKVLFFTNIPVPYRMDFFNELGKYCDLTVLMENDSAGNSLNRDWLKSYNVENYLLYILPKIGKASKTRINYGYHKFIKKGKYDIIIVGTYYSVSAMIFIEYLRIKRIPFILNSDGGFIKNDNTIKYLFKKHFISAADAYLSTGKMTSDYLKHYGGTKNIYQYPFTSMRKSEIPTTVTTNEMKQEARKANKITEKYVILYVGQLIYRKGIDILLKSIKGINKKEEIGLYIVGGEIKKEYKIIIEEENISNIHFIPFKNKSSLTSFYQAADLFILPTREDIWGLVINEAMSYGLPVITTNKCIAGIELIINNINGFIVPTNYPEKISEAINKIIDNEELMKTMQKNNLAKIKNYTIEEMAKVHISSFQDYLNKQIKE